MTRSRRDASFGRLRAAGLLGAVAIGSLTLADVACQAAGRRASSSGASPAEATPTPVVRPSAAAANRPPSEAPDPKAHLAAAVAAAGGRTRLDPLAFLPFAEQRARAALADAGLVGLDCFPVRDDGTTDLTLVREARCQYTFRSPQATRARPDLPVGIRTEARCIATVSVRAGLEETAAALRSERRADCRRAHLTAAPSCTFGEVWERARAAGAPAGAVATVRLAARHRSAYDPPDAEDDEDVPERGVWHLAIARDDGPDLRFETWDNCRAAPPSADERRLAASVAALRPRLRGCFAAAAAGHQSIEAFELVYRLRRQSGGRSAVSYADTGVEIEGIFQGSLGLVRTRFDECARPAFAGLRLPPNLGSVRLVVRIERDGEPQLAPPPYR